MRRVKTHAKITVYTDARLDSVDGFVGNFKSKVSAAERARAGGAWS